MQKKKLGILLSTPPFHPNLSTVTRLCEEGLRSDVDVYLYLIDEGVKNVTDQQLLGLSKAGTKLFACAYGCQQQGVSTGNLDPGIQLCGLVVLSNIINGCDRFVAFN
ncbi:MAG TPA: DsrE family protein [Nitrospiraceae bacterium]|nr:DsrE family protein [Nitrospiraceae bacterium]